MALDLGLLGSKLKKYREQFQASLSDVSAATGISEDSLVAFESGQKQPTGDEVLMLADYYKCDYKFFISNEQLAPFEQTEKLFRKHGGEISKEDRWAIQEFLFLCECEEFLMGALPRHGRTPFRFVKRDNYYKGHGEGAAAALRQHLGYYPNQIGMNVYEDCRRIGFHVFRRQLGNSNISGLYINHPTAGKCILVNYSEDVYRQRFTAAHEAAHAILDDDKDFVVSFTRWDSDNLSEVRANTFASRYLMPPEFLQGIPDSSRWDERKAVDWANKMEVNPEALAYALRDAKLISDTVASRIKDLRIPRESKVDPELPGNLSPMSRTRKEELLCRGLSTFYVGLCFDAYEQGIVSAGRLAEILLADKQELITIANIYGRSLAYGD